MELASRRLSLSLVASAALHAAVAAALLRSIALTAPASLEPAVIQVDLRWFEIADVSSAPNLGPARVAPAVPAAVGAAPAVPAAAPVEPTAAARIQRQKPPVVVHESDAAEARKPDPAQAAPRPAGQPHGVDPRDLSALPAVSPASAASVTSGLAGPAGAGPGSTASVLGSAVRVRYEQLLHGWLARFKQYPMLARRRGIEGIASVRLRVDRRGRVLARSVEKSTGERLLDDAAVEMTRRADPFPPLPGDYAGESFEFVAPIEFRLR